MTDPASMNNHRRNDVIFINVTRLSAIFVLVALAAIIGSLIYGALPTLQKVGLPFIYNSTWDPVSDQYGALRPITGTLLTSIIALVIGVPVSFGIALFLTELSPIWLRRPLGVAIELLAGIPSIIYGMFGFFVVAPIFSESVQPWILANIVGIPLIGPLFNGPPFGIGIFTAGLILAVMVIPFMSSVMRDVFEVVPPMLKESAYGLGATTWEVVRNVVLPYTKAGVIGAVMLGLGRALGETMAVTFVIGNSYDAVESLFHPGNSIASSLANEFNEAHAELHLSALISLGLVLFIITFIVLALSKLLLLRLKKGEGSHS